MLAVIRWISKHDAAQFTEQPEPPKHPQPKLALVPRVEEPPPRADSPTCNHTEQLERLISRMEKIDSHLSIITRALMGSLVQRDDENRGNRGK